MNTENKILGSQLIVMTRSDLDTMVNEMAHNIVASQTRNVQNDSEAGMDAPEDRRFITRKETASLLHVNFTTLWRWNKLGYLRSRKVVKKVFTVCIVYGNHGEKEFAPFLLSF